MDADKTYIQITPLLKRVLKRWPLIMLLGFIGVVVGFGISLLLPSRYEAAASIAVSVDYGRIEEIDLVTEERILDRVRQLMLSDETFSLVKEEVIVKSGLSDDWDSLDEFCKNFRLDARLSRWEMIGIHTDPEMAALLANVWQEINLSRLDEAMEHAWKAQSLQGVKFNVACVLLLTGEEDDSLYRCVTVGPDLSSEVVEKLRHEIDESHGIIPVIQYEPIQRASPPDHPVLWSRGLLIFSGGMAGFIIGFLVTIILHKESLNDFIA
jgi:hypothetical protein